MMNAQRHVGQAIVGEALCRCEQVGWYPSFTLRLSIRLCALARNSSYSLCLAQRRKANPEGAKKNTPANKLTYVDNYSAMMDE
jgi:hypothetical protein